jgi:ribosomal protein L22
MKDKKSTIQLPTLLEWNQKRTELTNKGLYPYEVAEEMYKWLTSLEVDNESNKKSFDEDLYKSSVMIMCNSTTRYSASEAVGIARELRELCSSKINNDLTGGHYGC